MQQTKTVSVSIADRLFTVEVTEINKIGDYNTAPSGWYELDSEIYDENYNNVTELIDRYESIYNFDFHAQAIENFND